MAPNTPLPSCSDFKNVFRLLKDHLFSSFYDLKNLLKLLKNRFFPSIPNSPWLDLPPEILFLIISSLSIQDRFRCRLVCRSWAETERLRPLPHQLPWLMLSLSPNSISQRFFSLSDSTMIQVNYPNELRKAMCCGSIDGSLVLNKWRTNSLLNPMSKSLTLLPQGLSCPQTIRIQDTPCFLRKVIFSSPPHTTSDHCHVAAIYDPGILFHCGNIIHGVITRDYSIIEDILFDQTNLWAISMAEIVYTIVPRQFNGFHCVSFGIMSLLIEKRVRQECDLAYKKHVYLVQLCGSGKLVMVLRYYDGEGSVESTVAFKVYELVQISNHHDRINRKWVEMNNLEGHVIFLSSSCSRAIPASNYEGLEEDKIYFADEIRNANDPSRERYECGDIGVFSLKNESITRLIEGRVNSSHSPPAWFFHLNEWWFFILDNVDE